MAQHTNPKFQSFIHRISSALCHRLGQCQTHSEAFKTSTGEKETNILRNHKFKNTVSYYLFT